MIRLEFQEDTKMLTVATNNRVRHKSQYSRRHKSQYSRRHKSHCSEKSEMQHKQKI